MSNVEQVNTELIFKNGMPNTLEERWVVLLKFIDKWFGVKLDVDFKIVRYKKASIGINYWANFIETMYANNDLWFIRDCYSLGKISEITGFSLMVSGEDDRIWCVKTKDTTIEDPLVYYYIMDYESNSRKFVLGGKAGRTLTGFFLKYMMDYMHMYKAKTMFSARLADKKTELDPLLDCFDVVIKFENCTIMESADVIAYYKGKNFNFASKINLMQLRQENPKMKQVIDSLSGKVYATSY